VPGFFAFLHHVAAFALVAALAVEFMLIRDQMDAARARRIRIVDAVFGASAGLVLIVGLARVFYFEKGAAFYFSNAFFLAKMALFVVVGLLSIRPTLEFLSWREALKAGQTPAIEPARLHRIRSAMHWELAGIVLILLCAALMARGVGQLG
jgi:putative membrane protein